MVALLKIDRNVTKSGGGFTQNYRNVTKNDRNITISSRKCC
jgi:hypothetical protein